MEVREFSTHSELKPFADTYGGSEPIAFFAPAPEHTEDDPRFLIGVLGHGTYATMARSRVWNRARSLARGIAEADEAHKGAAVA